MHFRELSRNQNMDRSHSITHVTQYARYNIRTSRLLFILEAINYFCTLEKQIALSLDNGLYITLYVCKIITLHHLTLGWYSLAQCGPIGYYECAS